KPGFPCFDLEEPQPLLLSSPPSSLPMPEGSALLSDEPQPEECNEEGNEGVPAAATEAAAATVATVTTAATVATAAT
ncbi:unnamed protein product, partial [Polarella glacialis]